MLNALIRISIRFRGVVIALACVLSVYGIQTLLHAPQDVFPEFAPPMAVVHTEAPGMTSGQVETLVTQPIEDALAGTLGLQAMRSKSMQGLSVVTLTFKDHADLFKLRQLTAERLNTLKGTLPKSVKNPTLLPPTSSTNVTLIAGLTSSSRSLTELTTLAQWTVKPQLMRIPGVADAIVFGGAVPQFQIQAEPVKLDTLGLTLQDLVIAAKRATGVLGTGYVETANQRITINTRGQTLSANQLASAPVRVTNGKVLRIGDVAKVTEAPAPAVGATAINGKPAVTLVIESQYGADLKSTSDKVMQTLNALAPVLREEKVTLHPDIFRPAAFIDTAIGHLRTALVLGGILVITVLFLFLYNARTALISTLAIPLSLLTAIIVLDKLGISLNTMTLGGLAIALGEVVDDAVVDVENIFRRLRQNRLLSEPLPVSRVVLNASVEVRSAVVYATLIVALVFLPVLTLTGVAGKLFAPLALSYVLAIFASLFVALTLTPALCCLLLTNDQDSSHETRFVTWLKNRYGKLLAHVENHNKVVFLTVILVCSAALLALPLMKASLIPELKEGHYVVHMALAPGSSLAESMRVGTNLTRELLKIPGVRLVAQRAGRADQVVDPTGVNVSEIEVDLNPLSPAEHRRALFGIEQTLAKFPGIIASANTFLTERIDESISGVTAPVAINIYGPDLDVIDHKASEVAQVLQNIPGIVGLRLGAIQYQPELNVRLKHQALSRWGLSTTDVLETLHTAYEGTRAAQVYLGNQPRDVTVSLAPGERNSVERVGKLTLRTPTGALVELKSLADISLDNGRSQIQHLNGQRVQTVSCGVRGRSISSFVSQAQAEIARQINMPPGTYILFSGEEQARRQSQQNLLMGSGVALIGVVLLLYLALRRIRHVLLVMANLPFALVGGVLALLATGGNLSLGSLVGFVTLFGITLRNSIMLITHFDHLIKVEGMHWNAETVRHGAMERLIPILMTAAVTGLGLLPLALASDAAGNEIEGPMAIVILGGLITSTLLNVLALPALALRHGRFETNFDEPV